MDERIVEKGAFAGRNGHSMAGGFRIVEADGAMHLLLDDGFVFDGAPAPWWGFGKDGSDFDRGTMFAPLAANSGAQSAAIPEGVSMESYDSVILWCRAVDSLLGVGAFQR